MEGLARPSRHVPPAHYILKIESFSQLVKILSDNGNENYESEIFEASGYKWKLSLYPNGHKEKNGEGYISLYLVIAETESLNIGWDVKVNLRLFVLDHHNETYTIFQDNNGEIRNLYESKTESGFTQLMPLSVFRDPSNGFLIHDKCVFGVEVFVLNYSGMGECLTTLQKVKDIHTWKIKKFSSLKNNFYYSDEFSLGNRNWQIKLYPKGDRFSKGAYVSLYLRSVYWQEKGKAYANFKLRVIKKMHGKHHENTSKNLFWKSKTDAWPTWGWKKFIKLSDLYDVSKGYLVKDTLIVEAELISISSANKFPSN